MGSFFPIHMINIYLNIFSINKFVCVKKFHIRLLFLIRGLVSIVFPSLLVVFQSDIYSNNTSFVFYLAPFRSIHISSLAFPDLVEFSRICFQMRLQFRLQINCATVAPHRLVFFVCNYSMIENLEAANLLCTENQKNNDFLSK